MGSIDKFQCGCIDANGLERVRYFPRQLLTADDMRLEQEYFREKQRRHNRFLHGWGVVCGLIVQPNPMAGPLAITICAGFALGPCGDEIYLGDPKPYDLTPITQQLAQPSCANTGVPAAALGSGLLAIMIRYVECQTRPVRTLPAGCGCDDSACEFSRIRDGFEIRAVPTTGDTATTVPPTLCEIVQDIAGKLPAFPSPPASDWVQLAVIALKGATAVTSSMIDNSARRVLFTTTQIQQQVIGSCCNAA